MMGPGDILEQRLNTVREEGRFRELILPQQGAVDFSSNDYLGLTRQSIASEHGGAGAGASRLLGGTSERMLEVETELARFYSSEAALIFASGYQSNLGLCSALFERGDYVLYDELVHASIRDGIRLGHARSANFEHNNPDLLREKIARVREKVHGNLYVLIESLYSMDGDVAPIREFVSVCKDFNAALIVDEAHSTGLYGKNGAGLVVELGLTDEVFARVHTFGKAAGMHGGCVVGSTVLIETLVNFSRPFIYTTAPSESFFNGILEAHTRLAQADSARTAVRELSLFFNKRAAELDIELVAADSPIKAVVVPGNAACRKAASTLQEASLDVRPVLSPTVPIGSERLRICLHSFNTKEQVERLLSLIAEQERG